MSSVERDEADRRVVARAQMELDWGRYRRVMAYVPIKAQREIDTWPLVHWLWEQWPDMETYLPRVNGEYIEAVRVTPETALQDSKWGVAEPAEGSALDPGTTLDLIIIPLLGFDAQGQRVGYGRGFYDRFLVTHPGARRVGLGYECLRVDEGIAAEDHDIILEAVITERQLYRFNEST
jgi:5-formyltetrahydrofolate cyclo-ligase